MRCVSCLLSLAVRDSSSSSLRYFLDCLSSKLRSLSYFASMQHPAVFCLNPWRGLSGVFAAFVIVRSSTSSGLPLTRLNRGLAPFFPHVVISLPRRLSILADIFSASECASGTPTETEIRGTCRFARDTDDEFRADIPCPLGVFCCVRRKTRTALLQPRSAILTELVSENFVHVCARLMGCVRVQCTPERFLSNLGF